jgi:ribonuclease HII
VSPRRPRPPLPLWLADWGDAPEGWIAGVDEVGRGPLAGPVVAAAVVFPPGEAPPAVGDSKTLSATRRAALVPEIKACAQAWALGWADVEEIDRLNILQASLLAMRRALEGLGREPALVLVDGNQRIPALSYAQRTVPRGDSRVAAIAAASILAKEARDEALCALGERYPGYGFERHSGYPVPEHLAALEALGPTPAHRRSFGPVRRCIAAFTPGEEPKPS